MEFEEDRLPSRAAHHSELGTALGRKNLNNERQAALRRRQSSLKMNQVSPHADSDMEEILEKHGLAAATLQTGHDDHKVLKTIKAMPRPMEIKRKLRDLLLAHGKDKTYHRGFRQTLKVKWRRFQDNWKEFQYSVGVWNSSFKKIEGHQGTAVLSYFVFLRSLFFLNIFMFLALFWIVTFFQVTFSTSGYGESIYGKGGVTVDLTTAATCSALYEPNVSHNALSLILDFVQGTGWMEDTALFYGYYTNEALGLAASEYNMPLAYFLTTVVLLLISLIVMVHRHAKECDPKETSILSGDPDQYGILPYYVDTGGQNTRVLCEKTISNETVGRVGYELFSQYESVLTPSICIVCTLSNFKETVLARENQNSVNYCNTAFAGMDYSVDLQEPMQQLQKSLYTSIVADLDEQRFEKKRLARTTGEKCALYTKRFFINFFIILLLGGAGAAIYFAQDFSSDFTTTKDKDDYNQIVFLFVEFLPAIVIGLLNGVYPMIFGILVTFEDYRPAFVIKISLIRTVFLKLASLAVIVTSLYIQITCNDQDSCLIGRNSCPSIHCWETYVGSAMYKLVIMDFLIDFGFHLGYELPRKLVTTKCDCGIAKKVGPAIFEVPINVLDLVYGQTLCWFGFFFSPLLPAVNVCKLFFLFYLKKLSALYNTVPPEKPFQASKSNSFFMIILMIAYFMICIPLGYVLLSMEPSPMCGPFRIYKQPKDIINVQIDNAAGAFQTIWEILTSSGIIVSLIIILILALYYCSALNSAHKELADMLKEQLVMEGKDKQFLLNKVNMKNGGPKKKPPPYQKSKITTVDETKQNGVTSVQYQEVKLYGDEHESSFVSSPMNVPSQSEYNDEFTNTNRHPGPDRNELKNNKNKSSNGISSPMSPNVTSVSQVQTTTIDDW